MKVKKYIFLLSVLLLTACGKKSSSPDPKPVPEAPVPAAATLTFPAQNSLCNAGDVVSDTQTNIILTWSAAANADSYEIDIKDLLTGTVSKQSSTTNQFKATLLKNTPYAWSIVSKSEKNVQTASSDTWKFYVAGPGITSYSPFPATLLTPSFAQTFATGTETVDLSWTGSDADNDIASYNVYLGTAADPPLLKSGLSDQFLNNITVSPGNTYYWKIITTDSKGNTSTSDIYKFTINQ
ncbi:hypothetical protein FO440_22525 [Mucilaginibacter corticis]|uniref:Fibronectin type-III domain-containing protein n=1 Tax=Mucilaginibacter corticis TaxID=2597670 RepID=A0A556M9W3_9SPHI|nr:hypothetical protein [Mucilaginibacter corticis]TSJ36605.1 hypothetical protein FO440_22525 [Mucilaginibacter corticis]